MRARPPLGPLSFLLVLLHVPPGASLAAPRPARAPLQRPLSLLRASRATASLEERLERLERTVEDVSSSKNRRTRQPLELKDSVSHYLLKPELEVTYEQARTGSLFIAGFVGCLFFRTMAKNLWAVGALLGYWVGTVLLSETGGRGSASGTTAKGQKTKEDFYVNGPASEALLMGGARLAFYYIMYLDLLRETIFLYRTGKLSYTLVKRYQTLEAKYNIAPQRKALQNFANKINKSTLELDQKLGVRKKMREGTASALEGASNAILIMRASLSDDDRLKRKLRPEDRERSNRIVRFSRKMVRWTKTFIRDFPSYVLLVLGIDPEKIRGRRAGPGRAYGSGAANERAFFRSFLLYPPRTPKEMSGTGVTQVAQPDSALTGLPLAMRQLFRGFGLGLGIYYGLRFAGFVLPGPLPV